MLSRRIFELFHTHEIMTDMEEKGQIGSKDHEHGSHTEECGPMWYQDHRQDEPAHDEEDVPALLNEHVGLDKG